MDSQITKTPGEANVGDPSSPTVNQIDLLRSAKGTMRDYLSKVLSLNDAGVFVEATCVFCRSKTRAEAENLWRQSVGLAQSKESEVRKLFLSAGEDIPVDVIRHHLRNHLDRGEAELRKIESISRISALNTVKVSTIDQIQLLVAACMERLLAIAEMQSPTPALRNAVEAQKNKDTASIIKTMQGLLSLQASILGEMKGRGELISIPVDKFKEIFAKRLSSVTTREEKISIIEIMEELTKANAQ